jgi:ribonuclease G
MAKEICISSTPHETRLAILEDDQLAEVYYERENEYTLAGSIYNGRVTRVLPGMQSAFVDIGLERDAFLYVTDFLELEDQEETDELEKAAVSPSQHPREVRHGSDRNGPPRHDRAPREQQPETEGDSSEPESVSAQRDDTQGAEESAGEHGARRWRGRRRRRGGRTGTEQQVSSSDNVEQHESAPETAGRTEDRSTQETPAHSRTDRAPAAFVLPGESLSKYGRTSAEADTKPKAETPGRPVVTSRPSTLIESPLDWNGSGLLPGESLSRHRDPRPAQSTEIHGEPEGTFADAEGYAEEQTFAPTGIAQPIDEELVEETLVHEGLIEEAPVHVKALASEDAEAIEEHTGDELEENASASHHVDPLPPSAFRLFGLGSNKKKKDEEESLETASGEGSHEAFSHHETEPVQSFATESGFTPGNGVVEEEVIEGEEFESPAHRHLHSLEEHDLDEYEEETLQTQIRSGALGEMLQEAHLDHRIQMDFDDKSVEEDEEEASETEEDESETVSAEGRPAAEGHVQPRRERGGRGRRGRGSQRQGDRRGQSRRAAQTSDLPIISDLLKPGQEILVQIAKEPIAKKGARITSHIALPGRFLVFMPTVTHVGVSRKIASDEERQRLKRILIHERGEASGGFIVRTAAEGASEEELRADLRFLIHLWNEIKQRSESSKSPALIYHDLSLIERILRDQVSANFSSIWVDSEADYERIVRFLNRFSPTLVRRVKLYTKETPLFEHFGIQDEISKALRSKVWLKSGGSIVINQTEALVAIDINTGKYVGKTARLEDTIVKTNLDAIPEIVRQIRLRDLGGIIIIDFIDMDERKNRFKVMAALEEALKTDRAPTKVLQFNDFGLVAITRKRVKQSLERTLSVPCPICQATGMVKSSATVCNEIYTEMRKMRKHFESGDVLLRVNPETVKALKANNARWLTDFEELTGKNILVKSDPTLHPEQFDIQG